MLAGVENNGLKKYISFCNYFHRFNSPLIRFKQISEEYKHQYKYKYNVDEEDVCKATFFVFIITLISAFFILICFIDVGILFFNVIFPLFLALIFAVLIAYSVNIKIYRHIKKDEKVIDTLLPLIKINFSFQDFFIL